MLIRLLRLAYDKLREIMDYNKSKYILSGCTCALKDADKPIYQDVLDKPITELSKKIIVSCNYDYEKSNSNEYQHNLLQYIHINTFIVTPGMYSDFDALKNNVSKNKFPSNFIFKQDGENEFWSTNLKTYNLTTLSMVIPSIQNSYIIINPSQDNDDYGISLKCMDFSPVPVSKFKNENDDLIQDDDLKDYVQTFDTNRHAFKLTV